MESNSVSGTVAPRPAVVPNDSSPTIDARPPAAHLLALENLYHQGSKGSSVTDVTDVINSIEN